MTLVRLRWQRRLRRVAAVFAVVWALASIHLAFGGDRSVTTVRYLAAATVTFDHTKHPQPCSTCHAAPSSQTAHDDLGPDMAVCATCHATQDPKLNACSACHPGAKDVVEPVMTREEWQAVRPAPFVPPRQVAELRFSHQKHDAAGVACSTCHGTGSPVLPKMQMCTDCHTKTNAPLDCQACHTTNVSAPLPTLKPANHSVDWIKRHGVISAADPDNCMACHTQPDCVSCHTSTVATPYQIHPPNFVTIHAVDARADEQNCTTCHSVQNFCTACHVRANVTARTDARPPSTVAFHPPGFVDPATPNNHGVMARRNINDCASCHAERDCISCHTGINPHPADFRAECRRWLEANAKPCAKCHEDPEFLKTQCF